MFKHRVFGYDTGDEMLKDLGPDESDWVITVQAQSSEAPISSLTSVNPWDRDDREQDIP